MRAPKPFHPPPLLPNPFSCRVLRVDGDYAICGSVTDCTIAHSLKRELRSLGLIGPAENAPNDFYIKVKPNRVMIRIKGVYHHFNMPDKGLKLVRQNDAGAFELVCETDLTLVLTGTGRQNLDWRDPARKAQINAARQRRKEEGRPDRTDYKRNERIEAAIRNGVKGKKLGSVRRAA